MAAAFFNDTEVLDALLDGIAGANAVYIVKGTAPTDRAGAVGANALATATLAAGDFTDADNATSGRQVTVAAKSDVSVTATGTPAFYCLVDSTNLIAWTPVGAGSPDLTSGSTVDIPAVVFSVGDPTTV